MAYSTFLFLLSPLALHFLVLTIAQTPEMLYHDCLPDKGNYSTNSTYQENLKQLLTSISTNTDINNGFYNFSYGENPDVVNSIALCRPDITPQACRTCIRNASDILLRLCPISKEAIGGLDDCMVRYSYRAIFRLMEGGPYFFVYGKNNVSESEASGFNRSRTTLLDSLRDKAAASSDKFAFDQTATPNSQKIYALVQCTPDLSSQKCSECLTQATELLPKCCDDRQGGRIITPSCNFRYEISLFYDPSAIHKAETTSPSPPPATNTARTGKASNIAATVIMVSFPMLL